MSVDAAPGETRQPLVIEGLAGLRERVGTVLGVSDWVETTQDNVDTFAKLTGDEQYIHVDPERAAKGPFGTTVQHGFLTLGTATGPALVGVRRRRIQRDPELRAQQSAIPRAAEGGFAQPDAC